MTTKAASDLLQQGDNEGLPKENWKGKSMTEKTELVQKFLNTLGQTPTDTAAFWSLLTEEVNLLSTSGNSSGREAVIRRLTEPAGRVFRESSWRQPEVIGDSVKMTGVAPGSGSGSPILVFHVRDGQISAIQHQFYTARNGTG